MQCRTCETEIDDNALICFRCGAPTTEPVHRPPAAVPRRASTLVPVVLGLVFVGVAGFFLVQVADGVPISPMVWVMLGAAGVLLAYRLRFR
jgi:hypothetical protein